jgi:hypothetical protein
MFTIGFSPTGMDMTAEPSRWDRQSRAIAAILIASFALSFGDAIVKLTSSSFVIWQIFVLRSALVLPLLLAFFAYRSALSKAMPTQRL